MNWNNVSIRLFSSTRNPIAAIMMRVTERQLLYGCAVKCLAGGCVIRSDE